MRFQGVSSDIVRRYLGGTQKVEIERLNQPIFDSQSRLKDRPSGVTANEFNLEISQRISIFSGQFNPNPQHWLPLLCYRTRHAGIPLA